MPPSGPSSSSSARAKAPAFRHLRLDGLGPNNGSLSLSPEAHSRALVTEIVAAVDALTEGLDSVTEETLTDSIEVGIKGLTAALGACQAQLPVSDEDWEKFAESFQQHHLEDSRTPQRTLARDLGQLQDTARQLALPSAAAVDDYTATLLQHQQEAASHLSAQEAQQVLRVVAAALTDIRAALEEVSREEIEELVEVGLAVSHLALGVARRASRQLLRAIEQETGTGPYIEDLSEDTPQRAPSSASSLRGRRWLWEPLWPRLRSSIESPRSIAVPAVPTVWVWRVGGTLLFFWPVTLIGAFLSFWTLVFGVPFVLILDEGAQRLYARRQHAIDECLDGAAQFLKLWYLTLRIAARRIVRFSRSQVQRALDGRPLEEAIQVWMQHPWSSVWAGIKFATHVTADIFQQAWWAAKHLYCTLPTLRGGYSQLSATARELFRSEN